MTVETKPRRGPGKITVELPDSDGRDWKTEKQQRPDETISSEDLAMQEAVRGLAQGERYVRLYRTSSVGGRPKFMAHLIPEEFEEGTVQERFGGGRYFARWKMDDGSWKRYPFEIDGPEKQAVAEPEVIDKEPEQHVPENEDRLSLMDMLTLMSQAEDRAMRRMQTMLEIMRPAAPPPNTTDQVLGFVEKLIPVMQAGVGEGQPWYVTLLTQFREPITKLADAVHTGMTRPAAPVLKPEPPAPTPKPPLPEPTKPTKPTEDDMLKSMVASYLPILVTGAKQNTDPGLYVDLIIDQLPAQAYHRLHAWLVTEGCLDELALLEPGIRFQQQWWEAFRAMVVGALEEELKDAVRSIQSTEDPKPATSHPADGATPA